jgi:hypothetical protein
MTFPRVLVATLAAFLVAAPLQAMECPNCALEFPSVWQAQEHAWGTRVTIEGQSIDLKVQPDEALHPLGPGDVADELVWLEAELDAEAMQLTHKNGRIVRTVSREPAVVLDYAWVDGQGGSGSGVRMVRRCGVRLIFEQQGSEQGLNTLLTVSDRVRYTRSECTTLNADVIPLEVLESVDRVQVAPVVTPRPGPAIEPPPPADPVPADHPDPASAQAPAVAGDQGGSGLSTLLLVLGLVLLAALVVVMLRSGRSQTIEGLPPLDDPERASRELARLTGEHARRTGEHARRTGEHPRHTGEPDLGAGAYAQGTSEYARNSADSVPAHASPPDLSSVTGTDEVHDHEHPSSGEFGDEDTDAILPAGTYGLRGAGGGDRSEQVTVPPPDDVDGRAPDSTPPEMTLHSVPADQEHRSEPVVSVPDAGTVSVPSHAVVSYPSVRPTPTPGIDVSETPSYEDDDVVRVSPVESVLASLGITTWLDFTAPGVSGVSFLPSTVASLVEVQNGGRFGYGWLLLLGLRRKNMDLMTLNGEARVKQRFGEGWLVGMFAFGNVLWVDPDQRWSIRTLEGEQHDLGTGVEQALRRLAEDPALRDVGAPRELVERCRSAVGELLPGWVYRYRGETSVLPEDVRRDQVYEPVEIVPFLELLG